MNDQENIKRIQHVDSRTRMIKKGRAEEWEQIRLEMEAGSSDIIPKNNFLKDKELPTLASILHELKEELQSQGDAVAEFETQDWQDEGEWIAQGWCEALTFAIKRIEEHTKSCEADQ
tara:strand:- start:268 stop:618 length:351 start_codon:yes stop_codon:yes gene_type:complete